jgi:hypothetical protein
MIALKRYQRECCTSAKSDVRVGLKKMVGMLAPKLLQEFPDMIFGFDDQVTVYSSLTRKELVFSCPKYCFDVVVFKRRYFYQTSDQTRRVLQDRNTAIELEDVFDLLAEIGNCNATFRWNEFSSTAVLSDFVGISMSDAEKALVDNTLKTAVQSFPWISESTLERTVGKFKRFLCAFDLSFATASLLTEVLQDCLQRSYVYYRIHVAVLVAHYESQFADLTEFEVGCWLDVCTRSQHLTELMEDLFNGRKALDLDKVRATFNEYDKVEKMWLKLEKSKTQRIVRNQNDPFALFLYPPLKTMKKYGKSSWMSSCGESTSSVSDEWYYSGLTTNLDFASRGVNKEQPSIWNVDEQIAEETRALNEPPLAVLATAARVLLVSNVQASDGAVSHQSKLDDASNHNTLDESDTEVAEQAAVPATTFVLPEITAPVLVSENRQLEESKKRSMDDSSSAATNVSSEGTAKRLCADLGEAAAAMPAARDDPACQAAEVVLNQSVSCANDNNSSASLPETTAPVAMSTPALPDVVLNNVGRVVGARVSALQEMVSQTFYNSDKEVLQRNNGEVDPPAVAVPLLQGDDSFGTSLVESSSVPLVLDGASQASSSMLDEIPTVAACQASAEVVSKDQNGSCYGDGDEQLEFDVTPTSVALPIPTPGALLEERRTIVIDQGETRQAEEVVVSNGVDRDAHSTESVNLLVQDLPTTGPLPESVDGTNLVEASTIPEVVDNASKGSLSPSALPSLQATDATLLLSQSAVSSRELSEKSPSEESQSRKRPMEESSSTAATAMPEASLKRSCPENIPSGATTPTTSDNDSAPSDGSGADVTLLPVNKSHSEVAAAPSTAEKTTVVVSSAPPSPILMPPFFEEDLPVGSFVVFEQCSEDMKISEHIGVVMSQSDNDYIVQTLDSIVTVSAIELLPDRAVSAREQAELIPLRNVVERAAANDLPEAGVETTTAVAEKSVLQEPKEVPKFQESDFICAPSDKKTVFKILAVNDANRSYRAVKRDGKLVTLTSTEEWKKAHKPAMKSFERFDVPEKTPVVFGQDVVVVVERYPLESENDVTYTVEDLVSGERKRVLAKSVQLIQKDPVSQLKNTSLDVRVAFLKHKYSDEEVDHVISEVAKWQQSNKSAAEVKHMNDVIKSLKKELLLKSVPTEIRSVLLLYKQAKNRAYWIFSIFAALLRDKIEGEGGKQFMKPFNKMWEERDFESLFDDSEKEDSEPQKVSNPEGAMGHISTWKKGQTAWNHSPEGKLAIKFPEITDMPFSIFNNNYKELAFLATKLGCLQAAETEPVPNPKRRAASAPQDEASSVKKINSKAEVDVLLSSYPMDDARKQELMFKIASLSPQQLSIVVQIVGESNELPKDVPEHEGGEFNLDPDNLSIATRRRIEEFLEVQPYDQHIYEKHLRWFQNDEEQPVATTQGQVEEETTKKRVTGVSVVVKNPRSGKKAKSAPMEERRDVDNPKSGKKTKTDSMEKENQTLFPSLNLQTRDFEDQLYFEENSEDVLELPDTPDGFE